MTADEIRLRARIRKLHEAGARLGRTSPSIIDRELETRSRALRAIVDQADVVTAARTDDDVLTTDADHEGTQTMGG